MKCKICGKVSKFWVNIIYNEMILQEQECFNFCSIKCLNVILQKDGMYAYKIVFNCSDPKSDIDDDFLKTKHNLSFMEFIKIMAGVEIEMS